MFVLLAPWIYWLGFDGHFKHGFVLWYLPVFSALGLSLFATWWVQSVLVSIRRNPSLELVVTPAAVAVSGVYSVTVAMSIPLAGPLLHGVCLAVALVGLGATAATDRVAICDSYLDRGQRALLVLVLLATVGASTLTALKVLPLRVVRESPHPVVHYESERLSDLKVTSAQGGFHVFVSGRLRFSSLDQARWAEALTRPALARVDCPKRALVLSLGEGLIERELLRDPCIVSIEGIARERAIMDAATREPWWRTLTRDAWRSPRVHWVPIDPARWVLTAPVTLYDLVIVDLPDPDDFIDAKYYTRYFYRELRRRLAERGVLVVQATSALRSPITFASIQATLEAAGFVTVPYRVAMTTLGEWSFLLAQTTALAPVLRPQWLSRSALGASETFSLPPDAQPSGKGQVSRLDDPTVLDAFLNEGGDRAP